MATTTITRARGVPVEVPRLVSDPTSQISTWLAERERAAPEFPTLWLPGGSPPPAAVRSREHLAVLVSHLRDGGWGIVERAGGSGRWGQTMRTPHGWIVEVHDGGPDDFAQRVFRGEPSDYPTENTDTPDPREVWTSAAAADVLWSWMHAGLPSGCSRTLRYLGPRQRDMYGL